MKLKLLYFNLKLLCYILMNIKIKLLITSIIGALLANEVWSHYGQ